MATDPVCGMAVKEKDAPAQAEHHGRTYYFCSPECKRIFQHHPEKYATLITDPPKAAPRRL